MSAYLGDFRVGKTIRKMWNSTAIAGESITRSGNGTLQVYKDGNTTQSTAGVTDTEDFDSLTGVHLVTIDTSANGTFYSAASDFELVLANATIDGKTINATLFSFSLENRSPLMPTTSGRTLDVNSNGEAGIDWANVGNQSATVGLSSTTIASAGNVTGAVLGGMTGNITGNLSGSVGSVVGNVGGNVGGDIGGNLTGNVYGNLIGTVGGVTGSVASVVGDVGGNVTGTVASVIGNVGGNVNGNVVGTVASVTGDVGGNLNGSVGGNVVGTVASVVGTVGSVTGDVGGNVNGQVGSVAGNVGGFVAGGVQGNLTGNVTGSIGSLSTEAMANVTEAANQTIEGYHLDHLFASPYDPASKPGAAEALLNELVTDSGNGTSLFTELSLSLAPAGGGGGGDATEAKQDIIIAAVAAANTSIGNANSTLHTAIADVPTVAEFNARTLATADYATASNLTLANNSISAANTTLHSAISSANSSVSSANTTLHAAISSANTSVGSANSTLHSAISGANTSISSANTTLHSAIDAIEGGGGGGGNATIEKQNEILERIDAANTTLHSSITLANQSVAAANTTLHAAIDGIESGSGANTTAIAEAVDTLLSTNHGNSSWETGSGANATAIADAVWDEALSGHTTSGTAGQLLGNLTLAAIADSVWDEATSGHSTSGTTGKALSDAGSAGDPWETAIGNGSSYTEGQAGQLLSKLRTEVANATVIVLPGDPIDDDLCHLYGQLVLPSGRLASAISLKLELGASTPIKLDSGRPVAHREVIARTDTDGYIISTAANGTIVQYQPIARTDKLSVGNASWSITSDALIFAQEEFYANGTTLDIATLI